MHIDEMAFVIESLYEGIQGGSDYLLRENIDRDTGKRLNDTRIIKWDLPINKPSEEFLEKEFKNKYKDLFYSDSITKETEEERKQKIANKYLNRG